MYSLNDSISDQRRYQSDAQRKHSIHSLHDLIHGQSKDEVTSSEKPEHIENAPILWLAVGFTLVVKLFLQGRFPVHHESLC